MDTEPKSKHFPWDLLGFWTSIVILIIVLLLLFFPRAPTDIQMCGDDNPCTKDYLNANGVCARDPLTGAYGVCSPPYGVCKDGVCYKIGSKEYVKVAGGDAVKDFTELCEDASGGLSCGDSYPACSGKCPSGYTCAVGGTSGDDTGTAGTPNTAGVLTTADTAGQDSGNGYCQCVPDEGYDCPTTNEGTACDCRETDCTDGVDNDGDRLIDCDDPDCVCIIRCDECADSRPPDCKGDCPPGYECEVQRRIGFQPNDGTTTPPSLTHATAPNGGDGTVDITTDIYCACVKIESDCNSAEAPYCEARCPREGYTCQYVKEKQTCECMPKETNDCVDQQAPSCYGNCPEGKVCQALTKTTGSLAANEEPERYCDCVPVAMPCGQSTAPECGGTCPEGEKCVDNQGCRCMSMSCEETVGPNCGGKCPKGGLCVGVTGEKCYCITEDEMPCEQTEYCGGYCDKDNYRCVRGDNDKCKCEPVEVACKESDAPACTGKCDQGYHCTPSLTYEGCYCAPDQEEQQYTCSTQSPGACYSGSCPEGKTCAYLSPDCKCVGQGEVACSLLSQQQCSFGSCPENQNCVPVQNGCACR